jgi:hypothetical protein
MIHPFEQFVIHFGMNLPQYWALFSLSALEWMASCLRALRERMVVRAGEGGGAHDAALCNEIESEG